MSIAPSDPARPVRSRLREEFAARLREELRAEEPESDAGAVPDVRRAYREAACLLSGFDPRTLKLPGEDRPAGGAVLALLDDCTTLGQAGSARWVLKPEAREAALRGLAGPDAARAALEANRAQFPAEPGGPEALCLALLQGNLPGSADRRARWSAEELGDALQAVLWLSEIPGVGGLPDPAELRTALARARLLEPLRHLAAPQFQGRAEELARLRAYVCGSGAGRDSAPTGSGAPPAFVPPLVIHGPGGMGKSTLMAKFLLDGLAGSADGSVAAFPFAYIDFGRPTLSIREPVTLIAEMARQLAVQYPEFGTELEALADECQRAAATQREEQERVTQLHQLATTRVLGSDSSEEFQRVATARETGLVRRVAEVLGRAVAAAGRPGAPFVLAVDTFEEAQYRGSPVLGRMWAICTALQSGYPHFRMLIAGRAPVGHPSYKVAPSEIELRELDRPAAVAMLRSLGVDDPEVAGALAERVGGHPLSLRLAARAAAVAGSGSERTGELIRDLPERRREVFRRVDEMLVQGILYDRILSHIADEDVRRLAHPGLVLRVITPGIVQEVLAGPCGLEVADERAARRLFDELRRLDMVEPIGPETVRYRPDVRTIMLRLPGGDRTEVMRRIERRAVAYYAAREGVAARAEEIYHRLRLDEDPRAVEERWLPGVERFLADAQKEVPPRAAGLLTARLGGNAPDRVTADADQEDWERIAAREAEGLLAQGFAEAALSRLGQRRPWTPCSPLHVLCAQALNRLGRCDEARQATAEAIGQTERAGCAERRLELLLLGARLAEEAGDLPDADRQLRVAEDVAVGLEQDLEAMGARLARARLPATGGTAFSGAQAGRQLATQLRDLPDEVLADQPVLVRAVAAQIYGQDPGALTHALDVVGLPTDDATLDTLGTAMRRATRRQPALLGAVLGILDEAARPAGRPAWAAPVMPGPPEPEPVPVPPPTRAGLPPGPPPAPSAAAPAGPPAPARREEAGGGAADGVGAVSRARRVPAPAASPSARPSGIAGILRLARDRGTLDTLAHRLLAVPDHSGEITAGVAAAMGVGTHARTTPRSGHRGPDEGSGPPGPERR
ncbi:MULTISPECIES: ATP-binding protein [unclassified Streptomyces]|uniref:ATP-binding protein n=1 Tax=unclassified Streptomyces TaxID=2593676 RepID=UPI0003A401AD|nr:MULTISPECIES: ATP-binding protein [unclassified Streptomyces]MYT34104.1 AAA family ATPase [Streptomyces sp. SID8354]